LSLRNGKCPGAKPLEDFKRWGKHWISSTLKRGKGVKKKKETKALTNKRDLSKKTNIVAGKKEKG